MAVIGFEALSVAGTAVGLTAATVGVANHAHIRVEVAAVRFRADGTVPTATVGTPLEVGDVLELAERDSLSGIQFIRRDGVTATLSCHYLLDD